MSYLRIYPGFISVSSKEVNQEAIQRATQEVVQGATQEFTTDLFLSYPKKLLKILFCFFTKEAAQIICPRSYPDLSPSRPTSCPTSLKTSFQVAARRSCPRFYPDYPKKSPRIFMGLSLFLPKKLIKNLPQEAATQEFTRIYPRFITRSCSIFYWIYHCFDTRSYPRNCPRSCPRSYPRSYSGLSMSIHRQLLGQLGQIL